jgi:hypothetical protein
VACTPEPGSPHAMAAELALLRHTLAETEETASYSDQRAIDAERLEDVLVTIKSGANGLLIALTEISQWLDDLAFREFEDETDQQVAAAKERIREAQAAYHFKLAEVDRKYGRARW